VTARTLVGAALVCGLAALAVPAGAVGAAGAARPAAAPCKAGMHRMNGHCMAHAMPRRKIRAKVRRRVRAKVVAARAVPHAAPPAPAAPPPPPPAAPPPSCRNSGLYGLVAPFLTHLSAAHLQESPLQQVQDLLDTDKYVLVHTALIDSMLAGLAPVLHDLLNGDLNGAVAMLLNGTCAPGAPAAAAPAPAPMPGHVAAPPPEPAPPPPAPLHHEPPVGETAVDMTANAYVPASVTVGVGSTVRWHNSDPVPHTVTSAGPGPLKSPILKAMEGFSFTFAQAGTYAYFCEVHPNMRGRVVVQ
jgi:hypothetical protein